MSSTQRPSNSTDAGYQEGRRSRLHVSCIAKIADQKSPLRKHSHRIKAFWCLCLFESRKDGWFERFLIIQRKRQVALWLLSATKRPSQVNLSLPHGLSQVCAPLSSLVQHNTSSHFSLLYVCFQVQVRLAWLQGRNPCFRSLLGGGYERRYQRH